MTWRGIFRRFLGAVLGSDALAPPLRPIFVFVGQSTYSNIYKVASAIGR